MKGRGPSFSTNKSANSSGEVLVRSHIQSSGEGRVSQYRQTRLQHIVAMLL